MAETVSVYRAAFRKLVGRTTSQPDQKRVMSGQTAPVRGDVVLLARPVDGSAYRPIQDLDPMSATRGEFYRILNYDPIDGPGFIDR